MPSDSLVFFAEYYPEGFDFVDENRTVGIGCYTTLDKALEGANKFARLFHATVINWSKDDSEYTWGTGKDRHDFLISEILLDEDDWMVELAARR